MDVEGDRESEGEEEGGRTLRALEALEFLTKEVETSGTMLVDARNGFNKMSQLAMLWTVRYLWQSEARFAFIAISIGHNFSSASQGICQ